MNYTLGQIARICGGTLTGKDSRADGVITDSRHGIGKDGTPLFVAIKGANHDGHRFIDELYRRGVRAFMVERDVDASVYPEAGFVRVEKSLRALQMLAADFRSWFKGTVVAVTGSGGKTTVKEWIAQSAPAGIKMFRSPRSYNSQLGVPLSILMMRGDEDMAVIEAGISRPGEMERLAAVIRPDIGIFTSVGDEHGENFESVEQKIYEKIKLFASCRKIIYNGRYEKLAGMLSEAVPAADFTDVSRYMDKDGFDDPASRENAALVRGFYDAVGMTPDMKNLKPVPMRIDIREGLGGSLVITDKSNTDVNSLGIALDYMKSVAGGRRRMLILSDILYSSVSDEELYENAACIVGNAEIDHFIGVGERIRRHAGSFRCVSKEFYSSPEQLLKHLGQDKISGMAILIKGNDTPEFRKIAHSLERKSHTTVLEIDLDAMTANLNYFRSKLREDTKIMAMVKASGYGSGNYEIANMLYNRGVDYLAVAFADEGVRLREQGITMPIVVLNADSDSFELMIANRLEPEIYNFTSLEAFLAAVTDSSGSAYPIHVKLDTGMHRLGFEEKDIKELTAILDRERSAVTVRSIFSHLAAADIPEEDDFTREQIKAFDRMSGEIIGVLRYRPLLHMANSAGMERFPEAEYDMCRLGIGLYGISVSNAAAVRSVSRLVTRIVQIKELDASQTVGYGRAGKISGNTRVATIPIGYADGLDRHLGEGRWSVMIGESRAPIIGRICMDSCMIDVTGIGVGEGDEVVVFGYGGENGVEAMAEVLGTIPYEIMTSVSERVKRVYIKE